MDKQKQNKESKQNSGRKVDRRSKALKRFSVTATILVVAILLILNLVFDSVLGDTLRWDWTAERLYSIGEVTEEILDDLDKDVEIIGLFEAENDTRFAQIQPMLEEYERRSDRLTVRYVNPDRFPGIIDEIDPEGYLEPEPNTFVVISHDTGKSVNLTRSDIYQFEVDYASMSQRMTGITAEQSITGAIKNVVSEGTPVIYFTAGHDEINPESEYSVLTTILSNNNYEVDRLDLFGLSEIPDDCEVLVMAQPQRDISPATRNILFEYLREGGSLMVLSDYSSTAFPELNELLFEFNLELSDDRIREGDLDHRFQEDPYAIRAIAPAGKVTESTIDGWTLVDNARGINELFNVREWVEVQPVLVTTDQGLAEPQADETQPSAPGVQNMAMLSEHEGWLSTADQETAKVMVIGSSSMFSDMMLQNFGTNIYNANLFFYSIQWMSGADVAESLYIEAKMPPSYTVTSGTHTTNVMTSVLVMLVLPAALLAAALIVFRKRKHL